MPHGTAFIAHFHDYGVDNVLTTFADSESRSSIKWLGAMKRPGCLDHPSRHPHNELTHGSATSTMRTVPSLHGLLFGILRDDVACKKKVTEPTRAVALVASKLVGDTSPFFPGTKNHQNPR